MFHIIILFRIGDSFREGFDFYPLICTFLHLITLTLNEAKARNFTIVPNNQSSHLGDGQSTIQACGEINTILYRDSLPLTFQALVCPKLHCPAIGGTLFIKSNGIKKDFSNNTISLDHDKKIVPATAVLQSVVHLTF